VTHSFLINLKGFAQSLPADEYLLLYFKLSNFRDELSNPEDTQHQNASSIDRTKSDPVIPTRSMSTVTTERQQSVNARRQDSGAHFPTQETQDEQQADTNRSGPSSVSSLISPASSETSPKTLIDSSLISPAASETSPKTLIDSPYSARLSQCETENARTAESDLECDGLPEVTFGPTTSRKTIIVSSKGIKSETRGALMNIKPQSKENIYCREPTELVHRVTSPLNLFPDIIDASPEDVTNIEESEDLTRPRGLAGFGTMFETPKRPRDRQMHKTFQQKSEGTYSLLQERLTGVHLTTPITPVTLHDYQVELAQPGVNGENCIICAPTGSGKTLTAAYICLKRMEIVKNSCSVTVGDEDGRVKFNALFVVCIRNLIQQQRDAICM